MQGGEGTRDEMCLAFLLYYPKVDLTSCVSLPQSSSFTPFTNKHVK